MFSKFSTTAKNWKIVLILVLCLLVSSAIALGIYNYKDSSKIQAVEKEVHALYADEKDVYIREDISQDTLDQVEADIGKVFFMKRWKLQKDFQSAKEKYEVAKLLNQIFDSKLALKERKDSDSVLSFREDLTYEKLADIQEKINFSRQDEFTDRVYATLNESATDWNQIIHTEDEVLAFKKSKKSDLSPQEYLTEFFQLEEEVGRIQRHPQSVHAQEALKEVAIEMGDTLQLDDEDYNFDEELMDKISNSPYLNDEKKGDERKLVALTFDDGPNPDITPDILDVLDKYDVKGTFYLLGSLVEVYPELVKETLDAGHELGNHSFTHANFEELTDEEIREEINSTQKAIKKATDGYEPKTYRLPYGAGGKRAVDLIEGMTSIIWNVDSEDWVSDSAQEILTRVNENLQDKSILLFHDSHEHLVPVLESLIPALQAEGYEFVTPEEINYPYYYY